MKGLREPDLLVKVLVLRLCQPLQQGLHWLDILDERAACNVETRQNQQNSMSSLTDGGIIPVCCHGEDGVERVVVRGAETAHHGE